MKNKNEAVVVFSGGQDSTTCLLWALDRYEHVVAVSFDYGQKHKAELECAKEIADKFQVELQVMDMSLLNQLAPNSLTRSDIEVDENAPEEGTPNSVVDGRNMLFLTFAAVFAKQRGITDLVTGVSQSDFSGYPDCRDVFIKSLMVISVHPSVFWFLVSNRTKLGASNSCNSALSSIVIIRSSFGIKPDNAFRNVVFPLPFIPNRILIPSFNSILAVLIVESQTICIE